MERVDAKGASSSGAMKKNIDEAWWGQIVEDNFGEGVAEAALQVVRATYDVSPDTLFTLAPPLDAYSPLTATGAVTQRGGGAVFCLADAPHPRGASITECKSSPGRRPHSPHSAPFD